MHFSCPLNTFRLNQLERRRQICSDFVYLELKKFRVQRIYFILTVNTALLVSSKHSEENSFYWNNTLLIICFAFWAEESLTPAENLRAGLSKLHYLCPANTLRKIHFTEKIQSYSFFRILSGRKFDPSRKLTGGVVKTAFFVSRNIFGEK